MSMTISMFTESLDETTPPTGLSPALTALWWAGKSDWSAAHDIVQSHEGEPECDWVHAWLHRREGDLSNARYWYRRAGHSMQHGEIMDEWRAIIVKLLSDSGY